MCLSRSIHGSLHLRPLLPLLLPLCLHRFLHSPNRFNHIQKVPLQLPQLHFQFVLSLRMHGIDLILLISILLEMDDPAPESVVVSLEMLVDAILLLDVVFESPNTIIESFLLGFEVITFGGQLGHLGGGIFEL